MRRVVVLASALCLALPAVAGARIILNKGMFGVQLGATMKQVRHRLGKADAVQRSGGQTQWLYTRRKLVVTFSGGHPAVVALYTANRGQRTVNGIGVGSTQSAVKKHVAGVHCSRTLTGPGVDCITVAHRGGKTYSTAFGIGANRRVRVVILLNRVL